ncbi:hypothetical protein LTR05_007318 [Lithohypha guttulata]|uniref:rRNA adenine N(6)-methyltransferase n=1 Tax=Lithohypha guttulata TaxID=1690604 RepID=A0AAN7Y4J6_9EURO|nr:hypothetical protein LTR05_007318 [Lithohypha guttulata]
MRVSRSLGARLTASKPGSLASPATVDRAHQLAAQFRQNKHDSKRRDIINQELCDQAIDILRPTLPAPGTFDIIDIHPGAAVWSQTLNAALKPRRHVLAEPERDVYATQIEPLLNQPDSNYVYAEDFHAPFIQAGELPFSQHVQAKSQAVDVRQSWNPQLIVTANLARKQLGPGTFAKTMIGQFCRSLTLTESKFVDYFKYGLYKLLVWVPIRDRVNVVPRSTAFRTRVQRHLDAAFDVREIVSSFPGDGYDRQWNRPWYAAEIERTREVQERQRQAGFDVPVHRQQPEPEPYSIAVDPVPENFGLLSRLRHKPDVIQEYLDLWDEVEKAHPEWMGNYLRQRAELGLLEELQIQPWLKRRLKRTGFGVASYSPRLVPHDDIRWKWMLMRNRMNTLYNRYNRVENLAREQIALEKELLNIRKAYPEDKGPYEARLQELKPAFEKIKTRHREMFKDNRSSYVKAIDDHRANIYGVLNFNRQDHEPLLCHKDLDFYPHQPLMLLELIPKASFVASINTAERQICFDYINHMMNTGIYTTLQDVLERLVGSKNSAVYHDLLATVPKLTDPLYGGYHDLSDVRVRAIHADLLVELAVAYEAWPLRRDIAHMLRTLRPGLGDPNRRRRH